MTGAAPGWYHAEGDPPNTERFWDGSQWTEGPRPIGGITPTPAGSEPIAGTGESTSLPTEATDLPEMPDLGDAPPGVPTSMPPIDSGYSPPAGGSAPIAGSGTGLPSPGMGVPGFGSPGLPNPSMGSAPPVGGFFAEQSKSTTALVLSIVGFFCCGFPAIGGIYYARQEQKGITEGRRDPSKQGLATAALVIGIVVLVLYVFIYAIWILALAFGTST